MCSISLAFKLKPPFDGETWQDLKKKKKTNIGRDVWDGDFYALKWGNSSWRAG